MTKTQTDIIKHLAVTNKHDYNLLKAAEELTELSEALLKRVLKGTEKVPDIMIIEEIGDVEIRVKILRELFNSNDIDKRIEFKLSKYEEYVNGKRFEGRI